MATLLVSLVSLGGMLVMPAFKSVTSAAAQPPNNPPADGINIIAFPQRDFISASGYLVDDQVVVRVIHDPALYGDLPPIESAVVTPQGDPADAPGTFSGIVEVNHPGGACWVGQTPDIRPGDRVQIEVVSSPILERIGRIDETTVANITNKRPVQTAVDTVEVHGNAQDTYSAALPGNPLPLAILEQRLVAPGSAFELNGRRTLRATAAAGSDGTLSYDPISPDNPNGTRWTATYTGLSPADVTLALGAESRGMWLGNAVLPGLETTVYEVGALTAAGPAAPCTAPLEVLPPPPGSELVPPTAPTGLTAAVDNSNTVTLNWTASTDNVGVTAYGIYRNGQALFTVQNPDASAPAPTTFVDRNTPPGTYTFQVRAFDEVGNASDFSATSNEITAVPQLDANNFPVNDPPVLPVNIITFPSRDFVSPSGYLPDDTVTVEVLRRAASGELQIVSSANGIIPTPDGFAEVNHPGGACWEGVTPDLREGDLVRTIAYNPASIGQGNPDGIRTIDQTQVAGVSAERPVVIQGDPDNTNQGIVEVHGTAIGPDGLPLPLDQIEQRMIATRDHFDFNGRRAMRAGGGVDGTLTYDTVDNPMGVKWTARYTGLDADDVARMAGGTSTSTGRVFPGADTRIHWLGSQPLLLAEATIYENSDGNPPGPAGPGCTRPLEEVDVSAPTTPADLQITQTGPDEVTLAWTASTDDWTVAGYRIYQDGVAIANAGPSATGYVLADVAVGSHTYEVRAFDHATPRGAGGTLIDQIIAAFGQMYGNLSDPAGPLVLDQIDVTAPSVPSDLGITTEPAGVLGEAIGIAHLTWTASTDDVGVASYNVYRDGDLIDTAAGPSYDDIGLAAGTYLYTVDAVDAMGNRSATAAAVTAVVTQEVDTEAPSIPGNVAATTSPDVHGRNIVVTWSQSTDNVGVAGYRVFRDGVQVAQVNGATLAYTDALLSAGTYTYRVTALDSAPNESAASAAAVAVVANDPPLAPHSLIPFPARDFVSATGYTPGETYTFSLIRGDRTFNSEPGVADATGLVEVNHPGGTCWALNTPDIRPGDVVRITDSHGVAEQTTVADVTAERPIAVNANTIVVHGTAVGTDGNPIPIGQLDQRMIAGRDLFEVNGRRALSVGAGDGTMSYDSPTSTHWTARYTGLSPTDMARAVGGTAPNGTVFVGAESRILWLGRAPLALTESTIFENGSGVVGGPSAPCIAPAEQPVPAASFTPSSVSFGGSDFLPTPKPSGSFTVTFNNGGGSPMTLTNIYVAGLNPSDFARTGGTCPTVFPSTLLVGIPCSVTMTFTPTALNLRQAYLAFTDDAANTTDQSIALTGIGTDNTDPAINVNPASWNFGTVNGGSTASKVFTITNSSLDPTGRSLTVSGLAIAGTNPGDFAFAGNTCIGVALAPATPTSAAGSCTVTVQFAPGARTARSASLVISHNAAGPTRATSTSVALTGAGGSGAVLTFNSTSISFGTVNRNTTKDQTITVKNSGNQAAALSLARFTVTGTGYSVRSTTCGNLAVNNSCNVVVRFTAPNIIGSFPGTLSVSVANGLPTKVTTNLSATTK